MTEHITRLDSGLTVAIEPMPATRTASIGVWVGVGARDEPRELSGVSHFLEHLLFKGTPTRSAVDISRAIDRVGGDINAFTSKEYTAYYCRVPTRWLVDGIELLGDVLTAPALRADEFENERNVILEELAMDDDSPDDLVHRRFARQVFGEHPLGRDTAGERDTVESLRVDDVRAFHAQRYCSGNTVVAIAGAVDADVALAAAERAFAPMPERTERPVRTPPDGASGDVDIKADSEQIHVVVGGRALARLDPDREALDVVNHVLGGGLSSRLFDEIRERRGLSYSVFSGTSAYVDAGAWSVYAGTLPVHGKTVHRVIVEQLERLVAGGITDEELDVARGYLTGSYEMGLEDPGARMSRLGGMLTTIGEVRSIEDQLARWEAVDHDDVRRVIRRVYAPPPLTVTLGPGYRRRR